MFHGMWGLGPPRGVFRNIGLGPPSVGKSQVFGVWEHWFGQIDRNTDRNELRIRTEGFINARFDDALRNVLGM